MKWIVIGAVGIAAFCGLVWAVFTADQAEDAKFSDDCLAAAFTATQCNILLDQKRATRSANYNAIAAMNLGIAGMGTRR